MTCIRCNIWSKKSHPSPKFTHINMYYPIETCKCCADFKEKNSYAFLSCERCKKPVEVIVSGNGDVLCTKCSLEYSNWVENNEQFDTPPINFKVVVSHTDDGLVMNIPNLYGNVEQFTHGCHSHGCSRLTKFTGMISIPTPDCLAFSIMSHYGCLPRPGFEYTVKIRFILLDEEKSFDEPVNTVFLQFRKPLENVTCEDGFIRTICPRWQVRCKGGNVKMCRALPLQQIGTHRIEMQFTRMKII
jgi:hypothetical protein